MKTLMLIALLTIIAGCEPIQETRRPEVRKYVPTPEMAVGLKFGDDKRKWNAVFLDGNSTQIIIEFTPEGQSIKNWKELVSQQIIFGQNDLGIYVNNWISALKVVDPNPELLEKNLLDDAILVEYKTQRGNEFGIRKFWKAKDGIYMLSYQVRPASFDNVYYEMWLSNIKSSNLNENPAKRR